MCGIIHAALVSAGEETGAILAYMFGCVRCVLVYQAFICQLTGPDRVVAKDTTGGCWLSGVGTVPNLDLYTILIRFTVV